jgi:putative phosphoribosyl transferase
MEQLVEIPVADVVLEGNLTLPAHPRGTVLFAHGSGSSRHSPRNRFVAEQLQEAGFATLLMDLLTGAEEVIDRQTAQLRFDIRLLAGRLVGATDWLGRQRTIQDLPLGYFGASTGAAAALIAAARRPGQVAAVVSRGGRPDLADETLAQVRVPTLLIVGSDDVVVIGLNKTALARLGTPDKQLVIVPAAGHLFEEPGALEDVALHASEWFHLHMDRPMD